MNYNGNSIYAEFITRLCFIYIPTYIHTNFILPRILVYLYNIASIFEKEKKQKN